MIDLRSDTVTKPSDGMRAAMAAAQVGDDMYREDPTINRLQQVCAELSGMEAALWVPSGTMANQIAIKVQTQPGQSMIVGADAHSWMFEAGAAGVISGVQVLVAPGDGRFTAAQVEALALSDEDFFAPTRLISIENTHNMSGGRIWDRSAVDSIVSMVRAQGFCCHLDGARLWNAAAASGRSIRELTAGFDTVSLCLSKGLGAPAGSVLCGRVELIERARRVRRMLGGAMRQVGVFGAAGLYALQHHRARLLDDHDNARHMARTLDQSPGLSVDLHAVQTNIIMVSITDPRVGVQPLVQRIEQQGVRCAALRGGDLRLVTHLDVTRVQCEQAADIIVRSVEQLSR